MEKLAVIIPHPRINLLIYHGAFAARGCCHSGPVVVDDAPPSALAMVLIAPQRADLWLEPSKASESVGKMNAAINAARNCIGLAGGDSPLGRQAAFALQALNLRVN